jgi:hypothetical protein
MMGTTNADFDQRFAVVFVGNPTAAICGAGASAVRLAERLHEPAYRLHIYGLHSLEGRPAAKVTPDGKATGMKRADASLTALMDKPNEDRPSFIAIDTEAGKGSGQFSYRLSGRTRTTAPILMTQNSEIDGNGSQSQFIARFGDSANKFDGTPSAHLDTLTIGRSNVLAASQRADVGRSLKRH